MLSRALMHGCVLSCVAALAPEVASACQYGIRFEIAEVRANGLVQLTWHCNDRYCTSDIVPDAPRIVEADTDAEVPGSVVWVYGAGTTYTSVFWKPANPLDSGRTYRVADLASISDGKTSFTALPEVSWPSTAELELEASLDVNEGIAPGEISCKPRFQATQCGPRRDESTPEVVSLLTRLQTVLWFEANARHSSGRVPPLKTRAVFWREGEPKPELTSKPWSLYPEAGRFTEPAEGYCYRYAVQNVIDGSERVWEGCLQHGELPALESRERSPQEIGEETVRCLEPPEGLEREWCEQSTVYCSGDRYPRLAQSDCDNVASRCAAFGERDDEPIDVDAGTDTPEPRRAQKPRWSAAGDRGCSIHGRTGAQPPLLLLLAAATTVVILRRRRSGKATHRSRAADRYVTGRV